jgi:hypothetical protein
MFRQNAGVSNSGFQNQSLGQQQAGASSGQTSGRSGQTSISTSGRHKPLFAYDEFSVFDVDARSLVEYY